MIVNSASYSRLIIRISSWFESKTGEMCDQYLEFLVRFLLTWNDLKISRWLSTMVPNNRELDVYTRETPTEGIIVLCLKIW